MSSRPPGLPEEVPAIVDTMVVRYFLLVDRLDLLLGVLGRPLMVSRVVFDPNDAGDTAYRSEIGRSIAVQAARSVDARQPDSKRQRALLFSTRLATLGVHVLGGDVKVVDTTVKERRIWASLIEGAGRLSLADGEAATIAIAVNRGWLPATDDSDALRALETLRPGHPYTRIRRILIDAAEAGLIGGADANSIHEEMRTAGFWDRERPFP